MERASSKARRPDSLIRDMTTDAPSTWQLVIPGPIRGYVRTTARQKYKDPRYKRYTSWKNFVRLSANLKGFPGRLDPDLAYSIRLTIWYPGRALPDIDNVLKGVLDALFAQDNRVLKVEAEGWEHTKSEPKIVVEFADMPSRSRAANATASGRKGSRSASAE